MSLANGTELEGKSAIAVTGRVPVGKALSQSAHRQLSTSRELEIRAVGLCQPQGASRGLNLHNLVVEERDFMTSGTGLPNRSTDVVILFKILHVEEPHRLLAEARRILKVGGQVGAFIGAPISRRRVARRSRYARRWNSVDVRAKNVD